MVKWYSFNTLKHHSTEAVKRCSGEVMKCSHLTPIQNTFFVQKIIRKPVDKIRSTLYNIISSEMNTKTNMEKQSRFHIAIFEILPLWFSHHKERSELCNPRNVITKQSASMTDSQSVKYGIVPTIPQLVSVVISSSHLTESQEELTHLTFGKEHNR